MNLGQLATLVSGMPAWVDMMINLDQLDIAPTDNQARPPELTTSAELVKAHENALAKAREALSRTSDEHLMTNWKLLAKGKVVLESPRYIMIRDTMCISPIIAGN